MIERLLDSVILIDHLNSIAAATDYISGLNTHETSISVITRAEILAGTDKTDETIVKSLLNQFSILNIDKQVADKAAELRRHHKWKLPDAFQAALAVHNKIKLVTRNTKDFNPKKHFFVEIPYSV